MSVYCFFNKGGQAIGLALSIILVKIFMSLTLNSWQTNNCISKESQNTNIKFSIIIFRKKTKNGVTSTSSAKTGSVTSTSSSDPPVTDCNMCNAKAKAQYHMVMSDNTLRSFCRYACATKYKNTFGYQVNGIQSAESVQTSTSVPILSKFSFMLLNMLIFP